MKNYYTYLSRREKEYQQLNKEYHQQVRKKLHKSINEIISKFPTVKKIIVFGSYLTDRFNKKSDLDLYIEEITGEEFYIIKNLLEDSLQLDVDIYTQTDSQRFIDKVKERGEILYERQTKNPGS